MVGTLKVVQRIRENQTKVYSSLITTGECPKNVRNLLDYVHLVSRYMTVYIRELFDYLRSINNYIDCVGRDETSELSLNSLIYLDFRGLLTD